MISWIFFDWAAQPYFTLITTFVFAPYFATHVAADPASGQSLWGFATAAAGLLIALMSPVLGAIADASGRRKPWIAAFGALLVIGSCLMWFGKPGDPSVIPPLLLAYAIATIGVEFATVFNNAMMPTLVPPDKIGRLSGTGWATGYVGGILSLILVLGFLAANPETGRTLFGFTPLFGLDPVTHQGDRITGPLTGIWFIIFVLPMFLLTPDYPARRPVRARAARGNDRPAANPARIAAAEIDGGVSARQHDLHRRPGVAVRVRRHLRRRHFRLETRSRSAPSASSWRSPAPSGAWLGGKLDDSLGPKRVIAGSMLILLLAIIAILLVDKDSILFVKVAPPVPGGALFASAAGARLSGARMPDRRRRRAAAGGVTHVADPDGAERPHRAIFRTVRADRKSHLVHRPAADRDRSRR